MSRGLQCSMCEHILTKNGQLSLQTVSLLEFEHLDLHDLRVSWLLVFFVNTCSNSTKETIKRYEICSELTIMTSELQY